MSQQYYLYDDKTKIIYHGKELPLSWGELIFLGLSDNPNPAMAAAVFLKDSKIYTGFRLRPMPM